MFKAFFYKKNYRGFRGASSYYSHKVITKYLTKSFEFYRPKVIRCICTNEEGALGLTGAGLAQSLPCPLQKRRWSWQFPGLRAWLILTTGSISLLCRNCHKFLKQMWGNVRERDEESLEKLRRLVVHFPLSASSMPVLPFGPFSVFNDSVLSGLERMED